MYRMFTYLWVTYSSACWKNIHDIDDLQKRLMQIWFDFEQGIIDGGHSISAI